MPGYWKKDHFLATFSWFTLWATDMMPILWPICQPVAKTVATQVKIGMCAHRRTASDTQWLLMALNRGTWVPLPRTDLLLQIMSMCCTHACMLFVYYYYQYCRKLFWTNVPCCSVSILSQIFPLKLWVKTVEISSVSKMSSY